MSASHELQRQLKRNELYLPRPAKQPPAGPGWIHELKHDGFRILAERDASGMNLHSGKGYDFADRFPLAAAAIAKLPVRSCLIHGEAIVCDANGLAVFDLLRRRWHGDEVILCAFDLLEVDGRDLRGLPIEERKATLAKLLRKPPDGIALNEHYAGEGAIIYKHACALGCEGIVSKRLGSRTAPAARTAGSGGAGGHVRDRRGMELGRRIRSGCLPGRAARPQSRKWCCSAVEAVFGTSGRATSAVL
jgi:bifunctional non-homologous end joining protein LigD